MQGWRLRPAGLQGTLQSPGLWWPDQEKSAGKISGQTKNIEKDLRGGPPLGTSSGGFSPMSSLVFRVLEEIGQGYASVGCAGGGDDGFISGHTDRTDRGVNGAAVAGSPVAACSDSS